MKGVNSDGNKKWVPVFSYCFQEINWYRPFWTGLINQIWLRHALKLFLVDTFLYFFILLPWAFAFFLLGSVLLLSAQSHILWWHSQVAWKLSWFDFNIKELEQKSCDYVSYFLLCDEKWSSNCLNWHFIGVFLKISVTSNTWKSILPGYGRRETLLW